MKEVSEMVKRCVAKLEGSTQSFENSVKSKSNPVVGPGLL